MRAPLLLFLFVYIYLYSLNTSAFGANGHRVVGEIANNHLSNKAKKKLDEILDGEPLSYAATWPDEMRSSPDDPKFWSYDAAANWHFVNVPANSTYEESEKNPKGDAYVALNTFIAILRGDPIPKGPVATALTGYLGNLDDPANAKAVKQFAVKFTIHIIGDLHQPLHAGHASDRGGNSIQVQWFRKKQNLHRVWDTELVEFQQLSFTEMVRKIDRASTAEIKQIQSSPPIDWLNESIKLRAVAYDVDAYNKKFSYDYIFRFVPLIESQMLKGGLRAASIFNDIYSRRR